MIADDDDSICLFALFFYLLFLSPVTHPVTLEKSLKKLNKDSVDRQGNVMIILSAADARLCFKPYAKMPLILSVINVHRKRHAR